MAPKKEKVQFSHGENFESVEDLLAEAMDKLDEANERIVRLLQSGERGPGEPAAGDATIAAEAQPAAPPAGNE